MDSIKELRSYCRRQYKLGDRIDFLYTQNGRWEQSPSSTSGRTSEAEKSKVAISTIETPCILDTENSTSNTPNWSQQPRWVVDLNSISDVEESIVVTNSRVWGMKECQQHQLKYIPHGKQSKQKQNKPSTKKQKRSNGEDAVQVNAAFNSQNSSRDEKNDKSKTQNDSPNNHHGGGKEKRLQAQELVSFFMKIIGTKLAPGNETEQGTVSASNLEQRRKHQESIRSWFNRADGVLDVAGGCGHVSMVLGMEGISSTVVDARASVGKLPKRDRKIWKRSLRNRPLGKPPSDEKNPLSEYEYCQPVLPAPAAIPFQSQQAWFGSRPAGYDASFRHPDEEDIPVLVATAATKNDNKESSCTPSSNEYPGDEQSKQNIDAFLDSPVDDSTIMRRSVSALVALHPDEATGEIVQQAVKHRIPFVVVPCCVFARLFPDRTTRDGRPVSSYEDLLDFLQEQDPSIQRTPLSFGGKNIALWSIFPDG